VNLVEFSITQFHLFVLVLFRIGGLLLTAPILCSRNLPIQLKVGFAGLLSLLVVPMIDPVHGALPANLGVFLLAVLAESALGMILGFAASLLFAAVQLAGALMDQELGFSLANVIDPISNEQVSVLGQFKLLLATAVFLALDAHHVLVTAVVDSFRLVPLYGFRFTGTLAQRVGDGLVGDMFDIAVRLAAPTIVSMFLATLALGFLARAVPEMNVFILGFSARIGIGLAMILLGVGVFAAVFAGLAGGTGALLRDLTEAMR